MGDHSIRKLATYEAIYAAFKGLSLDDFQKTRNAAITYGVGGEEK